MSQLNHRQEDSSTEREARRESLRALIARINNMHAQTEQILKAFNTLVEASQKTAADFATIYDFQAPAYTAQHKVIAETAHQTFLEIKNTVAARFREDIKALVGFPLQDWLKEAKPLLKDMDSLEAEQETYMHYSGKVAKLKAKESEKLRKGKTLSSSQLEKLQRNESKLQFAANNYFKLRDSVDAKIEVVWNRRFEVLTPVLLELFKIENSCFKDVVQQMQVMSATMSGMFGDKQLLTYNSSDVDSKVIVPAPEFHSRNENEEEEEEEEEEAKNEVVRYEEKPAPYSQAQLDDFLNLSSEKIDPPVQTKSNYLLDDLLWTNPDPKPEVSNQWLIPTHGNVPAPSVSTVDKQLDHAWGSLDDSIFSSQYNEPRLQITGVNRYNSSANVTPVGDQNSYALMYSQQPNQTNNVKRSNSPALFDRHQSNGFVF